ncbi:hypothetical protein ACJZ2D_010368 [Fusarium nematophilum]
MQSTAQPSSRRTLEKDEIRLLIYDEAQSQTSGLVACQTRILQVSHVNHGVALPYAALSYVWGDATITRPLICDGIRIQVTVNLEEALSVIWRAYPGVQLWADALSITQDNLAERNHQVSLMGDIFRSANRVLVSLGPALRGRNQFWDLLQSFVSNGDFDSEEFEDQLDGFMEGQANDLALGFNDLIQRPWFRRAWAPSLTIRLDNQTYQEIRLATTADVFCGDSFMPWNNFVESLAAFNKTGAFLSRFSSLRTFIKEQAFMLKGPSAAQAAEPSTTGPQPGSKETLLDLLVDGWPRDASDARDKIYAFTSSHLASASYAELRPDYTLDMQSTFIRLIRVHINNENDLNFLRFARGVDEPVHFPDTGLRDEVRWISLPNLERAPLGERAGLRGTSHDQESDNKNDASKFSQVDDGLPSWICDWRRQGLRAKVDTPPFLEKEHYFDVLRNALPQRQSVHDFGKRLVLKGAALARVGYLQLEAPDGWGKPLGTFSRLPTCALQKASCTKTIFLSRQSQLFDRGGDKNLPGSNMVLLLLQTLLHDRAGCACVEPPDRDLLEAHCPYVMYPRSCLGNLDWLFLLDGLADPVVLRPHVTPGETDSSRGEIGFGFVSVCPLVVAGARQKWAEAPFAYGEIVLY